MRTTKEQTCPHPGCLGYGSSAQVIKAGKDKRGRQRFFCKSCGRYFSPTKGTPFFRLRKPEKDFLEALAMLAPSATASRRWPGSKGVKEETVARWLAKAGQQAQEVEEALLRGFHVSTVQLDELWTYVGNKGGKGGIRRQGRQERSGRPQPSTR